MGSIDIKPLEIVIVGSGIAGLSAAISSRRAGHNVQIYERSSLNNEIGAAIHVCPNASRGLLKLGFDPVRSQLITCKKTWVANGRTLEKFRESDETHIEGKYGAPWYLAHRVDLHEELKRMATQEDGVGKPVVINLKKGDLIIAADGIHSSAVEAILGSPNPALPNENPNFINFIYRFLIPSSTILSDPETAHFLDDDDGRFKLLLGEGKRLVWYPCRNNEVQNLGAMFHSDELPDHEDWHTSVDKSALTDLFPDFHPSVKKVLEMATEVKQWPLLYRAPISKWHKERLVVIGDAAHPMLPHQGQSGAQAVEDALALGIIFSNCPGNESETISRRLQLFEKVRKNRGSVMQIFSNAGQDESDKIVKEAGAFIGEENVPRNPDEFFEYNFRHEEFGFKNTFIKLDFKPSFGLTDNGPQGDDAAKAWETTHYDIYFLGGEDVESATHWSRIIGTSNQVLISTGEVPLYSEGSAVQEI
ncbi:hypothetical protein G7Y89_g11767 [Cudoniella acicularis]|uniref:FAD-binding domain-containing protein n=1 Tax=Cudoniella acicularis TaxID=354080 RepID=A0A8H4RD43_9HELO|nr:hypothetical protein G7Y89_g11767 [Cudoniella acicularis]